MKLDRRTSIELRQLQFMIALADTKTVSGAAALLSVAQPSLSEALAKLEDQLDTQLVIRSSRGTRLTEAGEVFVAHARKFVADMGRAWDEVRRIGGATGGEVSLAISPSLAILLSVPLAETLRVEHPDIKLRIVEAMSGTVRDWVMSDEVNLGIIYQGQNCSHLNSVHILTEDLFFVHAVDDWPAEVRPVSAPGAAMEFADLVRLPLIMPSERHGLRAHFENAAKTEGLTTNVDMEIDSLRHISSIVARASAYTVQSHAAVFELVEQGLVRITPVRNPVLRRNAYLVHKRETPMSVASQIVQATLVSILRELVFRHRIQARVISEPRLVAE
ncbi:LysR family transcriptional regulator [Pseudooceanicola sp. 216_PA32_1]|uniref:LysR family transcriptional regulator n=1 Tax=Pseudooceanicola pacificus TaxID=2676438 RepID=A0A844W1B2_9RHOB|nr:LysR family transcriptional regulator [Pseudooceanicola pacificus]MWB77537.1 LysR family transcriptional regulator [Pseudooceanicola pacificus]